MSGEIPSPETKANWAPDTPEVHELALEADKRLAQEHPEYHPIDLKTEEGLAQRRLDVMAAYEDVAHERKTAGASRYLRQAHAAQVFPEGNIVERRHPLDKKTGVLSGDVYDDRIHEVENDPTTAVVLFDANHFKILNKRHGLRVGDGALRLVGLVLRDAQTKFEDSSVYRRGGDEFAAFVPADKAQEFKDYVEQTLAYRLTLDDNIEMPSGDQVPTALIRKMDFSLSGGYGENEKEAMRHLNFNQDRDKFGTTRPRLLKLRKAIHRRINPRD